VTSQIKHALIFGARGKIKAKLIFLMRPKGVANSPHSDERTLKAKPFPANRQSSLDKKSNEALFYPNVT
jgi:hypothetical protein